jgi:hypothetical protein
MDQNLGLHVTNFHNKMEIDSRKISLTLINVKIGKNKRLHKTKLFYILFFKDKICVKGLIPDDLMMKIDDSAIGELSPSQCRIGIIVIKPFVDYSIKLN